MHLHWGWVVLGALLIGAGVVWWMRDSGDLRLVTGRGVASGNASQGGADLTTLYRWVDAGGVINVSSVKPPPGTCYTIVHIDPNRNVVPMGGDAKASPAH